MSDHMIKLNQDEFDLVKMLLANFNLSVCALKSYDDPGETLYKLAKRLFDGEEKKDTAEIPDFEQSLLDTYEREFATEPESKPRRKRGGRA